MQKNTIGSIHLDSRWEGPHGIGRFAAEMHRRIDFDHELVCVIPPSHPLDCAVMSLYMALHPKSVVYSPGYNAPFWGLNRYILTVHDLNHIDIHGQGLLKRIYYQLIMRRACRQAARVLTVSEFSRSRIVEWAGVPESRVVNVGNGVGQAFVAEGPAYRPGYRYLLCVSNRKEHKNEERMLRGFAGANIDRSTRLLITGESSRVLLQLIEHLGLSGRVEFSGRLSDADLAARYRGAIGLLFVSLYEGFGLPIVEAMSCGTPVITSNTTAMPEIAGDAALLINPLSVGEISSAISSLADDNETIGAQLVQRGLERAKAFDWERVADRVFEQLMNIDRSW